jgi:ubiquinone/menaquinone biosynthesis C-methylase UbiE
MERALERTTLCISMVKASLNKDTYTYLDVGCGDGTISKEIAEHLNATNWYMADVVNTVKENSDKFILIDDPVQSFSVIPDKSIDVITCFVAIHHFEHFFAMFDQIARVLSDDGVIFIREHDAKDINIAIYLDIMHKLYPDDYPSYFRSKDKLRNLIYSYGLSIAGYHEYPEDANPQHLYHEVYKRTSRSVEHYNREADYIHITNNQIMKWIAKHLKETTKLAMKTGTQKSYGSVANSVKYAKSIRDIKNAL